MAKGKKVEIHTKVEDTGKENKANNKNELNEKEALRLLTLSKRWRKKLNPLKKRPKKHMIVC